MAKTNGHSNGGEPFFAGRLSSKMSPLLREWNETPRLNWELKNLSHVLRVDRAHVVMLREQGLVSPDQARDILRGLDEIRQSGPENFSIEPGNGSIVLQIEQQLGDKIGEDAAGRLPIARSRLDQGATVKRISDRDNILVVLGALGDLHAALLKVAEQNKDTPMISYTHLQQAQPANFGHYMMAFKQRLDDSTCQLHQLYERVDRCPLGTVGLSGTELSIDRDRTASLLGFKGLVDNSRAGRDGYYQIEIVTVLAMLLTVLNDLCTDLHIFSSIEHGAIEIHDSHCSTSSVFPQKKNPYALETIKGKGAEAAGWVASALATFRNEGTGDNQARTVSCLATAFETTTGMLKLASEIILLMKVKRSRWEQLLSDSWVTTNRLGNALLLHHNLSYRSAHGVVARLVRNCLNYNVNKADITVSMLQTAAAEMHVEPIDMTERELRASLDHTEFIRGAVSLGSVGPVEVERLLAKGVRDVEKDRLWVEDTARYLLEADKKLEEATRELMSGRA